MARIRSDKPESYQSETLAEVSLAAERTFRGIATIADDRGRLADKPAQINGELWSMRSEREPHTRDDLEAELQEMVKADLICRYTGCDGKRYIHPVKWDAHQKIDRPSRSRLPRCPIHQAAPDYCGLHAGDCPPLDYSQDPPEPSRDSREPSRDLQSVQTGHRGTMGRAGQPDQGELIAVGPSDPAANSRTPPEQEKRKPSRDSREPSMQDLGSRTVDRGSVMQPSAAGENAGDAAPMTITQRSKRITDAYATAVPLCKWPAVNSVVIKAIKTEKYADDEIRAAVMRLADEGRPVTIDTLRVELEGMPSPRNRASPGRPRESTTDRAVADAQALKARLAARRQEQP